MHIKEIIVDGFKSYAHRTVIDGFDPHFNAITGLNGSGKSNILDSICFVLGITNLSQVRAGNLSELVYKQGQAGVQKAIVTLVFHNDDPAQAPIGYEACPTVTVSRQVWLGGKSKYWINGKQASATQVQNLFYSVQLNVNNPHFLIMQGRITKVLGMRPPEILGLLEEAAGTRLYETKKKYSLQTIAKKQQKLDELNSILNERITPTLERLRGEKQAYLRWSKNQADLERIERFVVAAEYHRASKSLQDKAGAEEEEALAEAQAETKRQQQAMVAKQEEIKEYAGRLKGDFEEAHTTAKAKEDKESKHLVKETAVWQNAKETLQKAQADHETTLQVLQETKDTLKQQQDAHAEEAGNLQSLHDAAQTAQAIADQLAQDMQNWSAGVATSTDDNVGSLPAQISQAHSDAQTAKAAVQQGEMRLRHLEKEVKTVKSKLQKQTKSAERLRQQESKAADKVDSLQSKIDRLNFNADEFQTLDQRHVDLTALVEELNGTVDTLAAQLQGRLNFIYKDPVRGFDRSKVKGLVANLVTAIPDTKYATALEVVAGGRLYQVVVDEAITGKALLERGQLVRRVTIIPLDKIRPKLVPASSCGKASEIAGKHDAHSHPAIELIGFDESVRQAMEYVFGASLIVDSGKAANAICEATKTRTVTLDGDVYEPSGTISGGSKNNLGTTLAKLTELREAQAQLAKHQCELNQISAQHSALQSVATEFDDLMSQVDLAQAELATIRKNLSQTTFGMLSDQQKSMEAEIASLQEECRVMQEKYEAKTKLYERLQSQKEELTQQREVQWEKMQKDLDKAKKEATTQTQRAREAESQSQTISMELESLEAEVSAAEEAVRVAEKAVQEATKEEADLQIKVASVSAVYEDAKSHREEIEKQMEDCSAELVRLNRERAEMAKAVETATLKAKKISVALTRLQKEQEQATKVVASMIKKHPWIETEKEAFGVAGGDYDFDENNPDEASRELKHLQNETESLSKKVNKKVMSMIEKAEGEYTELLRKRKVVENDKKKIQAVIEELDVQKKAELERTWVKVNRDFGSIFSTLLPGARAKLEPPEGQEAWEGLEVKVAFGEVWKESLSELSGGQRSLLALSLILALLLFKPAPMYILDEVDAALDLSHTQNIGNMLKTHFSQSQFIVVSLKEGMFNNANVIFRTKFVDGVSTVTRTIGIGSSRVRALTDQNAASPFNNDKTSRRNGRKVGKENAVSDE